MDGTRERRFVPAFNWCDSRCERCIVEPTCPLRTRMKGQRWVHEMKGEDPDSTESWGADLLESLESTQKILEKIIEDEGIDLEALAAEPDVTPVSLQARRLNEAGMAFARAVGPTGAEALAGPLVLFVCKLARLAGHVDRMPHDDPDAIEEHLVGNAAPTFFLLEILRAAIDAAVIADGRPEVLAAMVDIDRGLAAIAPSMEPFRPELAEWIAAGEAPPPFIVLPHPLPSVDEPAANEPNPQ
jgi:hypothetical protein